MSRFVILLLGAMLCACAAEDRASARYRSVADSWPERDIVFIGDPHSGMVQAVSLRTLSPIVLYRVAVAAPAPALRVKADADRGQLWISDGHAIHVHDLESGELKRRIAIGANAVNDLALDGHGHGYYLNNASAVYRVDGSNGLIEPWFDLRDGAAAQAATASNGSLLASADGERLFILNERQLWQARIADRRARRIQTFPFDGCALIAPDQPSGRKQAIDVVSCSGRLLAQIEVDAEFAQPSGMAGRHE